MNNQKSTCFRVSSLFIFLTLAAGFMAEDIPAATERVVVSALSECPPETADTQCYTSVSEALAEADETANDFITIHPGTYAAVLTLDKNVSISGIETARTILTGNGSGPVISASNVTGVSIRRLTFADASTGIQVTGSTIDITNSVFRTGGIAVTVADSSSLVASSADIINNTFYRNRTGIFSSSAGVDMENNIFYDNDTAISISVTTVVPRYNCYYLNDIIGVIPADKDVTTDPLFTDPGSGDFHLKDGSPCIGAGTSGVDMGAYGGSDADTIPFPVTILSATPESDTSVSVSWEPNLSSKVTNSSDNRGSYNVVYNLAGGPTTTENVIAPGEETPSVDTVISGLTGTAEPPAAPVLNVPDYADGKLILSWNPVENASGYKVHFLDSATLIENTIDVGNTVFYVLTGLVNGRDYGITVSAYSRAVYHFRVTAVDNSGNESDYSEEKIVQLGSAVEGLRSSPTQTAYPDRIVGGPGLPDEGCFIATAAYGFYSAPQVQILRDFRDRYLVSNAPGRAFVEWYYRYGPVCARFMNVHPWLKPIVRTALLPLIGLAWLATQAGPGFQIAAIFLIAGTPFYFIIRRNLSGSGGAR